MNYQQNSIEIDTECNQLLKVKLILQNNSSEKFIWKILRKIFIWGKLTSEIQEKAYQECEE